MPTTHIYHYLLKSKIMKTILKTLVLFLTTSMMLNAQSTPFIGASIDPKMAVVGPYYGKPNDIGSTFNGEFKIGVEFDNLRYTMMLEIHPAINYTKWTWFALDYNFKDFPFRKFGTYVGIESSVISRKNDNPDPTDGNNYKRYETTRLINPGANLELQYNVYKNLYLSANINVFRAEQRLINDGKHMRWDAMLGFYVKI